MTVSLNITKPLFRKYLDFLFDKNQNGHYKVSKTISFGAMVCSMIQQSNLPITKNESDESVTFVLPQVDSLSNARNYHLYFSKENELRLNDLLREYFFIDFDRYYLAGRKSGFMQKDIINSFILSRQLAIIDTAHESIKKRHYREELKVIADTAKKLKNLAYNRNEIMLFSPKHVVKYRNPILS
jgi:hypothetical protein